MLKYVGRERQEPLSFFLDSVVVASAEAHDSSLMPLNASTNFGGAVLAISLFSRFALIIAIINADTLFSHFEMAAIFACRC